MALTINQQLVSVIDRSKRILIAVPVLFSVDALASALAIARTLEKKGKDVRVVCEGWNENSQRHNGFLPSWERIISQLERLRRYAVTVNIEKTPIDEVSYEIIDHQLQIYLQPKYGAVEQKDLVLKDLSIPLDLIITVGAPDMDSLGSMATQYRDLLYATATLNIDHALENEHFGQWQLVDVTSPSIAEIVFRLHDLLGVELIDEPTATLLLSGIIAATRSFTTTSVTPQTLATASRLMAMGGKREEIVKSLYWKRSVGSLKLFGKLLTRLHHDTERSLAIASVTTEDLLETHAELHEVNEVAEEIFHTSPDLNVLCVLSPLTSGGWQGFALSRRTHLQELLKPYKPQGVPHRVLFTMHNATVVEAQKELLEFLRTNTLTTQI